MAPFLNQAYDIDDPLFLWMAQQIRRHPFDPYGGIVHWAATAQSMSVAMQNPPLCSYQIAAVGSIVGFGEVALHLAFLLPAMATVLGTFALARRLCQSLATAALQVPFQALLRARTAFTSVAVRVNVGHVRSVGGRSICQARAVGDPVPHRRA